MAALTLDSVLRTSLGSQTEREQPWRKFGLLRNPFPSRSHPIWDVLYNQKDVCERFYGALGEFLRESNNVALFFTGGNRVGKTHFMEHHRRVLPEKLKEAEVAMPVAVVTAGACDFMYLYRQVIEHIDESLRRQTGGGLFQEPLPADVASRLDQIPPGDFRRAVQSYASATGSHDRLGQLLRQWLACDRLRLLQRRELGVNDNIDSVAHALNAFEALIKFLLLWDGNLEPKTYRCPGLLLFLDEFELVWTYRRDRRDQFLQSLRALIDVCPRGIFLCVGMGTVTGVSIAEVERSYPALWARFKGSDTIPALVQVGSVVDALGYANEFLEHGKQQAGLRRTREDVLTPAEIETLFGEVAKTGSVAQGDFFDKLHAAAERKAMDPAAKAG
jgi:P-loop Domain of unknown function (DUF2791)